MPLTDQKQKSWKCKRCDFEMVEINKNTFSDILELGSITS